MATESKYQLTRQGGGVLAMNVISKVVAFTVNGNTTISDATVIMPIGSVFHSITLETPVVISGTPTSCMFRAGTAAAGQQIIVDVDAKAAGHIAATIVAGFDKVANAAAADATIFLQLVTAGGTSSAGTINAIINYAIQPF